MAKRKPSPFKGRKNQLRLMRLDLNDGKMLKMTIVEMVDLILSFHSSPFLGDRSCGGVSTLDAAPQVEIYVWPYVFNDEEIMKVQPKIGLVFKNGKYIGWGLGDDGSRKDRFSDAIRLLMDPLMNLAGRVDLINALHQIEDMRERTIKVWR